MKTYLQILQLHAKVKDISYPNNLIKKDIKSPTVLWNQNPSDLVVGGFQSPDQTLDNITTKSEGFWTCLFRKEDNGELSYEDNCVHFQLYFLISSMAYFYSESLEKQISRKYLLIDQAVTNMFLSDDVKAKLNDIFQKTQRTYLAFLRFANIVRNKINKEKIDFDLRMEPIDIYSKYSISLMHNGAKYFFALTDLVNIIQTAIINSDDMFEKPLFPKNPYNNLPFTKTLLYNIYFRIKFTFLNVPEWIQLFYNSGFDLDVFKIENEQKLREKYIKNYVNNASIIVLNEEINSMISSYKRIFRHIHISEDFPKKDLVDIFRPYLFLYIMSVDGIEGIEKKRLSGIILKKKLGEFVSFNESFGRKIINTRPLSYIDTSLCLQDHNGYRRLFTYVTFNMKHPHFTFKDACESFDKKKLFKISSRNSIEVPPNPSRIEHPLPSVIDSYDNNNDNESTISEDESAISEDNESSVEEEYDFTNYFDFTNYDSVSSSLELNIYNELNHLGDLAVREA